MDDSARISTIESTSSPSRFRLCGIGPKTSRRSPNSFCAATTRGSERRFRASPIMLKKYWWPGNIRELENLIERLVAVSDKEYISEEDLPLEFHFAQLEPLGSQSESLFEEATNAFERNFILRALEKCGWNVTGTAEYLGVPLSTLKYKMDKLDVRQLAKRLRGA
ncbi:MAG: hypothetical protein DMF92_08020 [Acidobacteria bacterium]|nr:MAG: hypothetical protein DMF92_08020 [Acidobacteriota bacterium]